MTCRRSTFIAIAALLAGGAASAQSGGGYELRWNVLAAGGNSMRNGSYALDGTVGSVAASACQSSTAGYKLRSGFWAGRSGGDVVFRSGFESGC